MGIDINDATIGKNTKFAPDVIWSDQAGPNDATITSGEFMLAQTLGTTQLKVVAGTDGLTTGGSNVVSVAVVTSPTSGGSFDNTLITATLPVSTAYEAGDDVFSFIPAREVSECYAKITVTVATDDLSGADLDAFTIEV